ITVQGTTVVVTGGSSM
nr:immunoglobulin heavy chain junction region [Mus musculus]